MRVKSFFKKFFLGGELIYQTNSPINGEISIFENYFGRWMRIGGVSQSGGLVVGIWKEAINQITNYQSPITNCLILGLGCGNAAKLVAKKWPEAKIAGVEIDQVVVEIGKKYFKMDEIKNLEIVVEDAIEIVHSSILRLRSGQEFKIQNLTQNSKFDLILVDLYLGKQFPKEAESKEFLENVKELLTDDGIVVFNRFYWGEYKKLADDFKQKLEEIFPKVWFKKTVSNKLLFASNLGSIEV